jgi:glycosyltransferase involved in cell wall biosynthesis
MRIAVAGQNFHIRGGSDRVLFDELKLLHENGHDAAPFCAANSSNLPNEWSTFFPQVSANLSHPTPKDVARYIYNFDAKRSVRRFIEVYRPDIFHLHIYYGKLTASILGEIKSAGIPIVQTMHEFKAICPTYSLFSDGKLCEKCSDFRFFNAVKHRCNRGSLSRSIISTIESYASLTLGAVSKIDRFIAVSEFQAEKVAEMGVPREKITTIRNFIDVDNIVPSFRKGTYFIYFGRLEINKGIWPLLKAFEAMPDEHLLIVGDGSEKESLERHCTEHALTNVKFKKFCDQQELGALVRGSIASIVPSIWYETFGLSAAESLAYGKPVIASRIGGLPEVVSDMDDAILVEPGNVAQLRAAVERLSKDGTLAETMGRLGRDNVERKFNRHEHYQKLLSVYRSLI